MESNLKGLLFLFLFWAKVGGEGKRKERKGRRDGGREGGGTGSYFACSQFGENTVTEEQPKLKSSLRNFRRLQLDRKALHNGTQTVFLSRVSFSFPPRPLRHPDPFSYVRNAELKGQSCVWLLGHVSCPCAAHIPDPLPCGQKGTSAGCREIQFGLAAGSRTATESALTFGRQRTFPGLGFGRLQAEVRSFVCTEENPRSNASWFLNPPRSSGLLSCLPGVITVSNRDTLVPFPSHFSSHDTCTAGGGGGGMILFIRSFIHSLD